jgi:hypothetical protein
MHIFKTALPFLLLLSTSGIHAGEVSAPTLAKILRIVATSSGSNGRISCLDPEVTAELTKLGVALDAESPIIWVVSEKDVTKYAKQSKFVICGQVGLLAQGACMAIVAEGGRPAIYFSPTNASTTKVAIPDTVVKIGKVVK